MGKLFLLLGVFFSCNSNNIFEFIDNKKDNALGKDFIRKLVDTFNVDIFFETGTCEAKTTINAAPFFKSIFTIELHATLFKNAKAKLATYSHVNIFQGTSPEYMKSIIPNLKGTVLFWLDAHYSGEATALSFDNPNLPEAVTAIRAELAAIKETNIKKCIILIDDIRGFGTEISGVKYLGCWAYPTVQEVQRTLYDINPNFEVALLGDILLAYDKLDYQPLFSETVKACTRTRLYDGYNLSDQELLKLEEIIKNAPLHEKEYIKNLYNNATDITKIQCFGMIFGMDLLQ